jgi:hypothetical protein
MQVDAHRHQSAENQRHKPIITQQIGKLSSAVPTDMQQVKDFKIAILSLMEI